MTSVETENHEHEEVNKSEGENYDPYYEPIISLPEVEIKSLEEDETEMLNLRAKLFRFDNQETPPEWKERGTGVVKILRHNIHNTTRVVMRRDKTLKLCANHFIKSNMELKPSSSCDRAWVYSVSVDFVDQNVRSELLAIKFANVENAKKWKDAFEEAKKIDEENENNVKESEEEEEEDEEEDDDELNVKVEGKGDDKEVIEEKKKTEENNEEVIEKLSTLKVEEEKLEK